jgi:hypothetical protein
VWRTKAKPLALLLAADGFALFGCVIRVGSLTAPPLFIAAKVEPNTAEPSPLKLHDGSGLLLKPHSRTARYCRVRKL